MCVCELVYVFVLFVRVNRFIFLECVGVSVTNELGEFCMCFVFV